MDRHTQTPMNANGTLYNQFAPSAELAPYVACFWTITAGHGKAASRIRVLPDGCMDAIFDLTGGLAPMGVTRKTNPKPTAFLTGVSTTPTVIALPRSPRIVGVRFKPGGAVPFISIQAHELVESSADLDDVLPGLSTLGISLAGEARTPAQMAKALDRLLLEKLHRINDANSLTAHAVKAMTTDISFVRVEKLTSTMGVSQKKLERTLKSHTGLTPKKMGRTVRFVAAIRALTERPDQSLTDLALTLGFTDQAHFNREFKSLSGLSPTQWGLEQNNVDFLQYTPVLLT